MVTGTVTAGTLFARYALSLTWSMLARTSPYSPPAGLGGFTLTIVQNKALNPVQTTETQGGGASPGNRPRPFLYVNTCSPYYFGIHRRSAATWSSSCNKPLPWQTDTVHKLWRKLLARFTSRAQTRCFSTVMMPVVAAAESRPKTSFSGVHPGEWHFLFLLPPN